jgi:hypothetical protein
MKEFFITTKYRQSLIVLGGILLLLVVFQAGIFVGFHKARSAMRMDDRFARAYGAHYKQGPFGIPEDDFPAAHGTVGKVLSVSLPTFVVEDKGNARIVRTATGTEVREGRDDTELSSIDPDDFVVVIGSPNDSGEIVAKFVRLVPPPPDYPRNASSTSK